MTCFCNVYKGYTESTVNGKVVCCPANAPANSTTGVCECNSTATPSYYAALTVVHNPLICI